MAVRSECHQVVVVGGGVAGTTCAETVVAHAKLNQSKVRVTLVSADTSVCVGRALSSSARAQQVHVHCVKGSDWAKNGEVHFLESTAIGLNTKKQVIELADGSELKYNALCIATGAAPITPSSLAGAEGRIHVLRDTKSFLHLKTAVASARDIAIVGNGGVALEIVHALTKVHVKWIYRDSHPGAAFFDERSVDSLLSGKSRTEASKLRQSESRSRCHVDAVATILKSGRTEGVLGASHGPFWQNLGHLQGALDSQGTVERRAGVEVLNVSRKRQNGTDERLEVVLSTGEKIVCDLIVCGTGVAPSVKWLDGSGLELEAGPSGAYGVSVHAVSGRSSVENVFAAGDCSTVLSTGKDGIKSIGADWFQRYLWTQARAGGTATGRGIVAHLMGIEDETGMEFELFTHATRFFDVPVIFLGRYAAQGLGEGYKMLEESTNENFVRVVLHDGRVRGALLVGEEAAARSETYENLILDALHVEHLGSSLVNLDAEIEDYFD